MSESASKQVSKRAIALKQKEIKNEEARDAVDAERSRTKRNDEWGAGKQGSREAGEQGSKERGRETNTTQHDKTALID